MFGWNPIGLPRQMTGEENQVSINRIAVIGTGTMGHGIAQLFALTGLQVVITDRDARVLGQAIQRIETNLKTCLSESPDENDQVANALARITAGPSAGVAAAQSDFVVEAVVEDLEVKHQVLRQIEENCPAHCIVTSTTSSYCARDLAAALSRPERFLVTHYWNPPYLIPVVEVVPGDLTSPQVLESTIQLLKAAGKVPALVKKDVPGFVGNRLQHAMRREAVAIIAEGIASPEDVDLITRLSFGLRLPLIGPLKTADLGGLDLTLAIQSYLLPELDRSTEPQQLVRDKVGRGELGAKAGKGFYNWPPGRSAQVIRQRDEALMEMLRWLDTSGFLEVSSDQWGDTGGE
jgi:3-hydroxyacyl-CoA dehydrogenase